MKIKKIAALCKETGTVRIYTPKKSDYQFVGTTSAIYPMFRMPLLTESTILAVFDVPEKAQDDYIVSEYSDTEITINLEDSSVGDVPLERLKYAIDTGDNMLIVLQNPINPQMAICIDAKYLAPISDHDSARMYYMRDGLLVVKEGLLLVAIICPLKIPPEMADGVAEISRILQAKKVQ